MNTSYLKGDATSPINEGPKIIVHVCNDIGAWGRGFVLSISEKWKEPEASYRAWHKSGLNFSLGEVQFVPAALDLYIGNMICQRATKAKGANPPIRHEALEIALRKVATKADKLGASVKMPRIGCSLAGGEWAEIEKVFRKTLLVRGIETFVYDLE